MANSRRCLSARMPCQLRKLRNNLRPLQNWRWKNEVLASCTLKDTDSIELVVLLYILFNTHCLGKMGINTSFSRANLIRSIMDSKSLLSCLLVPLRGNSRPSLFMKPTRRRVCVVDNGSQLSVTRTEIRLEVYN